METIVRELISVTVFILSLGMAGCSWMTSFVVQNDSNVNIRVRYSARSQGAEYWYVSPRVVESSTLGNRGPNWNETPDANYTCDMGIVEIAVPPKHAVLISRSLNYTKYATHRTSDVAPVELTIMSPLGQLTYTGHEVEKAFVERSNLLYVLKYK
jgi:hypothetical protein